MVEIRLHGPLAVAFGQRWDLAIETPREAIEAIEANRPGIRQMVTDLAAKGMVFRVRSKTHDYGDDDVGGLIGNVKRIDIIPIVRGSGPGIRFVLGAALVAVGFAISGFSFGTLTPLGTVFVGAGVSLMLGSVIQWLTPVPKKADNSNNNLASWTIGGAAATAAQGAPVPVIYGEVLTGGYPVSAGISASQLDRAGSQAPSVSIGGDTEVMHATGGPGDFTSVLRYSAAPFNMNDPISWAWSFSGFAGATAVRASGQTTATLRLEVDSGDPLTAPGNLLTYTGTVTVTATGAAPNGATGTVTATATQTVTLHVYTQIYEQGGG